MKPPALCRMHTRKRAIDSVGNVQSKKSRNFLDGLAGRHFSASGRPGTSINDNYSNETSQANEPIELEIRFVRALIHYRLLSPTPLGRPANGLLIWNVYWMLLMPQNLLLSSRY
jgi:hypothetical protein